MRNKMNLLEDMYGGIEIPIRINLVKTTEFSIIWLLHQGQHSIRVLQCSLLQIICYLSKLQALA